MLTITDIQAMTLHIHTQGRFNKHRAYSLYRNMVTATSVMGVMKMGNTVPRAGLELTSLALRTSMQPLYHHTYMHDDDDGDDDDDDNIGDGDSGVVILTTVELV